MSFVSDFIRARHTLPDLQSATWLLRAALGAFIIYQGVTKIPLAVGDAESFGVPFFLWALAAFGEIVAGILLVAGGFVRSLWGDLITRAGGLAIAVIVASVLVVVYWAPPLDLFLGNQFHLLLLVGGLYFALRGNAA